MSVWVGYPNGLKPMLTEYNGKAVAGGTYPALIFKTFMDRALHYLDDQPEAFSSPQFPSIETRRVVFRDGIWQADNGACRNTVSLTFFSGEGPSRVADCRPNEVVVPNVLGLTLDDAITQLSLQPLKAQALYKPAAPGQPVGVVLGEIPTIGSHLTPLDTVRLAVAKPLHGVVPNVVGLATSVAQNRLAGLGLKPVVTGVLGAGGTSERVVSQKPSAGVAAAEGMQVTLVVAQ